MKFAMLTDKYSIVTYYGGRKKAWRWTVFNPVTKKRIDKLKFTEAMSECARTK